MFIKITAKRAFILFMAIAAGVFVQAVWWIIFMARLIDEKVEMAEQLGADADFVTRVHEQEISRQIMLGSEGTLFLLVILFGAWLIYRALVETEGLKARQHNFMLSVTHELKTPLASLRIYLDTLQSPKISDEKKRTILPRMKQDAIRLEKMIGNILEATRFDSQKYLPDLTIINFTELVQGAVTDLQRVASGLPKTIETNLQPSVMLNADGKALRRAIDAILENSLKYHGGRDISVRVNLRQTEEKITLEIKDQGIGFDPKEASALFDRFYRLGSEMTRITDGTGLGLYLCREIIKAHGGEVTAHSEGAGTGARFIVTLKGAKPHENNPAG